MTKPIAPKAPAEGAPAKMPRVLYLAMTAALMAVVLAAETVSIWLIANLIGDFDLSWRGSLAIAFYAALTFNSLKAVTRSA